ncbi:hypothetical protein IHE45_12G034100 [Dioscorea alata]|uniref:Uncharacterized protein n=1 Tax=Dioscorea alata TaxID=55571 RepID=A0ACB7V141_DIOAL|nr:hypothetical protein IHE45_12G034100 [Dioscorea alata]
MPNLSTSTNVDGVEPDKDQDSEFIKESSVRTPLPVQDYAVRFLEYTSMSDRPILPEAPTTAERIYDTRILEMSWEDHLSEVRISVVVFSSLSCMITLSVLTEIPEKSFLCFS